MGPTPAGGRSALAWPTVFLGLCLMACGGDSRGVPAGPVSPNAPPAVALRTRRVNDEIAPGRYYTDPLRGCFWERIGPDARVIASEFLGFDAGQEIVDIAGSDEVFRSDVECGVWQAEPAADVPPGAIPPGRWLVGGQLHPAEYAADASAGCYWARLRGFGGVTSEDVIENGFVADGSQQRVSLLPTDLGFFSDAECGTWMGTGAVSVSANPGPRMTPGEIGSHWRRYRVFHGLR